MEYLFLYNIELNYQPMTIKSSRPIYKDKYSGHSTQHNIFHRNAQKVDDCDGCRYKRVNLMTEYSRVHLVSVDSVSFVPTEFVEAPRCIQTTPLVARLPTVVIELLVLEWWCRAQVCAPWRRASRSS